MASPALAAVLTAWLIAAPAAVPTAGPGQPAPAAPTRPAAVADRPAQAASPGAAFEPCRDAAGLAARSLSGKPPAEMPGWPLYMLELEIDPARRAVFGTVQITFAAPDGGIRDVVLVLPAPAEADGARPLRTGVVRVAVGDEAELRPVLADRQGTLVTVPLSRPAAAGERVLLRIELDGDLPRLTGGSYDQAAFAYLPGARTGTIGAFASDEVGATLLGAHPVLAPRFGEAWSRVEPAAFGPAVTSEPACVLATVTAPPGLVAAASGELLGEVPERDGRVKRSYAAAGIRRFGVVLRPANPTRVERTVGGVTVRVTGRDEKATRKAAGWAVRAMKVFSARYGAYPWSRLEIIEAPVHGLLGGLHAPGLVVVNDLLSTELDPMSAALVQQDSVDSLAELTVVHQLAHQWFGELVAAGGPLAPALEEALAQDAAVAYARSRYGAKSASTLRKRAVYGSYHVWRVMGSPDAPADRPASELGVAAWTALCQGKTPGLLAALEKELGGATVRKALRRYTDAARFGRGDRTALVQALSRVAPRKRAAVTAAFERWLDEAHGDEDLGDPGQAFGDLTGMLGFDPAAGPMPGLSPQDAAGMQQLLELMEQMMSGY